MEDAVHVLRVDAAGAELVLAGEALRTEPRQALDIVAHEQGRERRLRAARRDDHGQRAQDHLLALLGAAQCLLGLQLLAAHAQVLDEQATLLLGLPADLLRLAVEVHEHVDLGPENERLDRLEHVIDRAGRVAAEDVQVVLVEGRQEEDRDARRARTAADHAGDLVAVEARHLHVEQDQRELVLEHVPQGCFAGCGEDQLQAGGAQHLLDGEQVAPVVVDDQDLRRHRLGTGEPVADPLRPKLRLRFHHLRHADQPSAAAPLPEGAWRSSSGRRPSCTRRTARS